MARDFWARCFRWLVLVAMCSQAACSALNVKTPGGTSGPNTQAVETPGVIASDPAAPTVLILASATPQPSNPSPTTSSEPTRFLTSTQTEFQSEQVSTTTGDVLCDKAAPGSPIDVTIPDNSRLFPGQAFTKIWRLVNIGQCRWTSDYTVEWFSGEKFGETRMVSVGSPTSQGESVDITVDMVAPLSPGTYQSNWKLRNPNKEWFGIGPKGDQVFWVRIQVIQVNTNTPTQTATDLPPSATPAPTQTAFITPTVTLTATATPVILISGEITLTDSQRIDLDTAQIDAEGVDLGFQKDETNNHWFTPQPGAVLGVYGGGTPTLPVCVSANMSAAPIAMESLSPGTALCYRTDLGRFGWLRYVSFDPGNNSINLTIVTWVAP